ncbi:hypothetical protein YC2023_079305 [Brassica napus]|uniref:25S rRNA (uridine-N(3))-methyltransferase BMT5-like domain-containing protein n=1 Tax=Brassica oleracea TaxID=3712 RepID=A0A3P6GBP3_BRAOL|nr:unnamed protein product [Brassica oleracea]
MLDFDFLCGRSISNEPSRRQSLDGADIIPKLNGFFTTYFPSEATRSIVFKIRPTIFNFPHSGFLGKDTDSGLTEKHIDLVFGLINGASHMVRGDGGIHVSHKDCYKPSVTRKIKFLQCI